jgi:Gas vesicle synthesis protein GvpL/GvpF
VAELYLYGVGIFEKLPRIESRGVHELPVDAIDLGRFAALVSTIEVTKVETRGNDLRAHNHVLEEAMEWGVVLPVRFGVVVPDQAALESLVRHSESDLIDAAERVRGRCEASVAASCDEEEMLAEIVAADPEVRRLRAAVNELPEDAGYFKRIELGERVAHAVEARAQALREQIFNELSAAADDSTMGGASFPTFFTGRFLIRSDKLGEFTSRARKIQDRSDFPMSIDVAGPIPPYAFVDIELAVPAQQG